MTTHPLPSDNSAGLPRKIELGWLIAHELGKSDLKALMKARERMAELLAEWFPDFVWSMPMVQRAEVITQRFLEPSQLLVEGVIEREMRHWDFTLVVTHADLQSYYKPFALAVPSRAVGVAVLSTARLLPEQTDEKKNDEAYRRDILAHRITALGLHLLGDLNGLPHAAEAGDCMFEPASVDDLDRMEGFSEEGRRQLAQEFGRVGDVRLEELPTADKWGTLVFYLQALKIGKRDILSAIFQAKPWEFPFRLSRLTTAALSASLILLLTAEVWDLGMNQAPLLVGLLTTTALVGTSLFVLKRQNLLLHRGGRGLTEQIVFANISTTMVVLLGMATTYLFLFGLAFGLGQILFPRPMLQEWAASLQHAVTWKDYLVQAGFVASLGILIGALGASFEGNQYFRHITFVDEEI